MKSLRFSSDVLFTIEVNQWKTRKDKQQANCSTEPKGEEGEEEREGVLGSVFHRRMQMLICRVENLSIRHQAD